MDFLSVYLSVFFILGGLMTALWVVSLVLRNSSIVDIFWGTGFVIVSWVVFALTPEGFTARRLLISILVTIWGLRLSLHILKRNWGKPEDFRYQAWRNESGKSWWWWSLFKVFFLQGLILWIISAPLVAAQINIEASRLNVLDILAILIWLVGFFFEAVGDWQLMHFRADPANQGKVLQSGVWKYTRHPNYFGDATQWWAFYLIAVAAGGILTIFSPLLMTFLLLRVSGVRLLEKSLVDAKPGYREYAETTSEFIPWFPRTKKP